jgi:hypothetical protein
MHRFSQRLVNLLHNEPVRRFPEAGAGRADLFQHIKLIPRSDLPEDVEQILLNRFSEAWCRGILQTRIG